MLATTTIASGATGISADIDLGTSHLVGIEMPTTWVAAAITFQVSGDNSTWMDLYDDGGTEVSFTVAASRIIGLRQNARSLLSRFRYLRLRSGTSAAPVNQTATRTLKLYCCEAP